jgi:hypothetical protein
MANPSLGKSELWQTEPWQSTSSNPASVGRFGYQSIDFIRSSRGGRNFCDEIETVEAVLSPDLPLR